METNEVVYLRKYLTSMVGNVPFGIVCVSENHEVAIINAQAVRLLGFEDTKVSEFIDVNCENIFINMPKVCDIYKKLEKEGKVVYANIDALLIKKHVVNVKIRPLFNGFMVILEDITMTTELYHQATHDNLTSLSNRREFENVANRALIKANERNLCGAIFFIDLDRFKPVNDIAGHDAGDKLLQKISFILKSNLRSRDVLARIGGDEFAVLLEDCAQKNAMKIAEAMRKEVEKFIFVYNEHTFKVGLSIGITPFIKEKGLSYILNSADNACNIAKKQGRNCVHVSENTQEYQKHIEAIDWINKIEEALKENLFVLYQQEIASLDTSEDEKHYELLLRLKDGDKIISPDAFIPSAERYNLMTSVDRWVIENAFKRIKHDVSYSINLSGESLSYKELVSYILMLKDKYKIDASKVTFEITETASIKDYANCMKLITSLKKVGFRFSLDDFGSGLSSFMYLKDMDVDYLKIDGSFVKEIAKDKTSFAMVKSIHEIGHIMGIKTIAEFVENVEILDKLKEIGVNYAQGYYIHKPEEMN